MAMLAYLSWKVVPVVRLGPLHLRPHGLLIAVGFVAGALVLRRLARARGIPDSVVWRVALWALIGGLVGMRAAWLMGHWGELDGPIDAFALWEGGMSLLGGLIGGVLFALPVVVREGLSPIRMLDLASPGIALGIVIGRASDLIIGDHLGRPTGLPWGFRYVGGDPPGVDPPLGAVVHPVALYDLLLTALLLVALLRFLRTARAPGSAIALFTLWYATGRLLTDFLRTDPRRLLGMTGTQLVSLGLIAVTVFSLSRRRRTEREPVPAALEPTTPR